MLRKGIIFAAALLGFLLVPLGTMVRADTGLTDYATLGDGPTPTPLAAPSVDPLATATPIPTDTPVPTDSPSPTPSAGSLPNTGPNIALPFLVASSILILLAGYRLGKRNQAE